MKQPWVHFLISLKCSFFCKMEMNENIIIIIIIITILGLNETMYEQWILNRNWILRFLKWNKKCYLNVTSSFFLLRSEDFDTHWEMNCSLFWKSHHFVFKFCKYLQSIHPLSLAEKLNTVNELKYIVVLDQEIMCLIMYIGYNFYRPWRETCSLWI